MIQQTMDASHLSLTFVTCTHHESAYTDYVSKRRSGIQQQRHCVGLTLLQQHPKINAWTELSIDLFTSKTTSQKATVVYKATKALS